MHRFSMNGKKIFWSAAVLALCLAAEAPAQAVASPAKSSRDLAAPVAAAVVGAVGGGSPYTAVTPLVVPPSRGIPYVGDGPVPRPTTC